MAEPHALPHEVSAFIYNRLELAKVIYDTILTFCWLMEIFSNFDDIVFILVDYDSGRLNEISF